MRENIYFCLCAYGHIRFLFSCIKAKEDDDDFCLFAFSSSCLPRRVYYLSVRVSFFFLYIKSQSTNWKKILSFWSKDRRYCMTYRVGFERIWCTSWCWMFFRTRSIDILRISPCFSMTSFKKRPFLLGIHQTRDCTLLRPILSQWLKCESFTLLIKISFFINFDV